MATGTGSRPAELEARALAAVAAMPAGELTDARWSGLGGASINAVELVDAFGFDDGGALAIVEARLPDDGTTVRFTLPLDGTEPWSALHALASRGGTATGTRGGRLVGRPGPDRDASDGRSAVGAVPVGIRPSTGDQSHSSVIVDERWILKLYRRLTPGPNPEAELLGALAGIEGAPVPPWGGEVDLVLATGETTALAIEQSFIAGTADAFELHAEGLAAWLAGGGEPVPVNLAGATGVAIGRLHVTLATLPGAGFTPRAAAAGDRAAWLADAEARLPAAVGAVAAVDPALAARLAGSGHAVRRALRPLGDAAIPVRLQRIHGDLHLGQVLPTEDGVLLVDFEGDPMLPPTARRSLGAPLADLAGFLRSIDHVARSGFRRAMERLGSRPGPEATALLDGWIASARAACIEGYGTGLGSPGWTPDRALLRAFEVDKELREFVYAAAFLPAWLYAPAGGLAALLGENGEPGGAP